MTLVQVLVLKRHGQVQYKYSRVEYRKEIVTVRVSVQNSKQFLNQMSIEVYSGT